METHRNRPEVENRRKKYVIEYDLAGKMAFPDEGKPTDREIIAQLTEKFMSGKFRIIDTYIVYGPIDEGNYYEDEEANGTTVLILQADFMQPIYPDYLDFIDYIIDQSLVLLQTGNLRVACCFKMKQADVDVYMVSLAE